MSRLAPVCLFRRVRIPCESGLAIPNIKKGIAKNFSMRCFVMKSEGLNCVSHVSSVTIAPRVSIVVRVHQEKISFPLRSLNDLKVSECTFKVFGCTFKDLENLKDLEGPWGPWGPQGPWKQSPIIEVLESTSKVPLRYFKVLSKYLQSTSKVLQGTFKVPSRYFQSTSKCLQGSSRYLKVIQSTFKVVQCAFKVSQGNPKVSQGNPKHFQGSSK